MKNISLLCCCCSRRERDSWSVIFHKSLPNCFFAGQEERGGEWKKTGASHSDSAASIHSIVCRPLVFIFSLLALGSIIFFFPTLEKKKCSFFFFLCSHHLLLLLLLLLLRLRAPLRSCFCEHFSSLASRLVFPVSCQFIQTFLLLLLLLLLRKMCYRCRRCCFIQFFLIK